MKPPLELHVELVTAEDNRFRWGAERGNPGEIPTGLSFATKRYEGFERAAVSLKRDIKGEYPDLGLFDGLNFVGYDGSVAYEGRVAQVPRSTPNEIAVEATGWMAHARDQKFAEVYVDADLSRWTPASMARQVDLTSSNYSIEQHSVTTDPVGVTNEYALRLAISDNWVSPYRKISEALYAFPEGSSGFGYVHFWSLLSQASALWALFLVTDADGNAGAPTTTSGNYGAATATITTWTPATRGERYLRALWYYTATPAGAAGTEFTCHLRRLRVMGNHGLTWRGSSPYLGYYASDMISDICSRWCPKLNPAGVQDTTWVVPHAAWHDRTDPYEAWQQLNAYHLWELGVWEGRTLHYYPADLTDYDWQVRTTDPGVSIDLQGDSTDTIANYAVVQFQNVLTGQQDSVSPDTHPELRDDSAENPLNRHGLEREFGVTLSVPSDPDGAAQIGRAALAENNQPRGAGSIRIGGHVRDRAGNWQPGWKVRATDTIAVVDHPNDRPRMIVETQWDHDTKQLTVGVDSTLKRVDAYLDRFGSSLRAAGLSN